MRRLGDGLRLERQVDAEDVLQERAERVRVLLGPNGVVLDVAQIPPFLLVDPRLVHQPRQDVVQRACRALELDHLSCQLVDATGDGRAAAEDLVLDLVDVVLEAGDDRLIAVDDVVDDRVRDRHRAPPQQIRARLEPPTHRPQLRRVAVAHGDDELRADEDLDLAEHDRLRLVHVAGRSQDDEERVPVALELRALMRLDCVLDRELVQVELARHRGELLLARLVEAQPGDRAAGLAGGVQLGEVVGLRRTTAVAVDGAVDDHARTVSSLPAGSPARAARNRSWEGVRLDPHHDGGATPSV